MDLSLANVIPCNGPCRKRFHPATVNLDQTVADVLRTSNGKSSGLWWFCPECRQTVDLPLHYVTDLSAEMLGMIFQYLDVNSLLEVRSTCHRWKDIVDQSYSLRKEFFVAFNGKFTMDETFQPENLLPASRTRLNPSKIICVESWWPAFGAALTELSLCFCEIGLPVLLGMLRATPNLISLSLDITEYNSDEVIGADFRLEKLESLFCRRVLDIFGDIFPRLRKVEFLLVEDDDNDEEIAACLLMRSVQGTLKNLSCYLTQFIVDQICSMDQLKLETVDDLSNSDLAVQLSQMQPSIRVLSCQAAVNEDLIDIGKNLKNLEELSAIMPPAEEYEEILVPSFLTEMPQLTKLTLAAEDDLYLNFERIKCSNLSYLSLDGILDKMPQLKELEIMACPITDKSVEFITENCSHLLVTIRCDQVSSVARKLLNRVTRKQEHFSNIC
ncbi:hypothetical protein pipiens_008840 [Culex pipiens pipiens]|uniref:F-box domain-containing protein n=1 Tax=Culex pipiens pipiens TaxID=38569 RepID=A0ABD1DGB0_CULPP